MDTPETLRRVRDHWHLCRATARRKYPGLPESEIDDLESVALQGLLKAARSWRPGGGASFSTYAITGIQRAMVSERIVQARRRERETGGAALVSLDAPVTDGGDTLETFLPDLSADTEAQVIREMPGRLSRVWAKVSELSPRQREAIRLYYGDDLSLPEVASAMGVPYGTARNAVHRGLKNVRASFT